jgi:DNA polymerase
VHDLRARYLGQLVEMGERDIVLEGEEVSGEKVREGRREREGSKGREGREGLPPAGIVVEGPPAGDDLFAADPVARLASLEELAEVVDACRKCALGHSRMHSVPGEGDPHARLVVVGEAPGATEDETGRPFVGRAGQLLTDILRAIGLEREQVFICNVLKCRPPNNRDPEPLEVAACSPYLHRQLDLIRPKVILAMGRPAAHALLGSNASLNDLRGKLHRYRGIPLIVTYHPAALLRNPHWKRPTWDDVRIARRILDGQDG